MKRKITLVCLVALYFFTVIFFTGCGGNDLSGTWVVQGTENHNVPITIEFRGNRFTATTQGDWLYSTSRNVRVGGNRRGWLGHQPDSREIISDIESESGTVERGTWERRRTIIYRVVTTGTFSITDDRIELSFSDGQIRVEGFSRTDNTVSIGRYTFRR